MTREIIDDGPLLINTFACGKGKECVQFTITEQGVTDWKDWHGTYTTMSRDDAINFLEKALSFLIAQSLDDMKNPPWWQVME